LIGPPIYQPQDSPRPGFGPDSPPDHGTVRAHLLGLLGRCRRVL